MVVDGGGQIRLAGLKADVRLTAVASRRWMLSIGGREPEAVEYDVAPSLVDAALGRLAELGPGARGADLSGEAQARMASPTTRPLVGLFRLRETTAFGLALPFGSVDWQTLAALGGAAEEDGVSGWRLAPHHGLLALGASATFPDRARELGLITEADDRRLSVSACIGSEGCASGRIPARSIAARLAATVPPGVRLHVSGCSKGCAYPRAADVTLVGLDGAIGLVTGGRASDTPHLLLGDDEFASIVARTLRQG